MPLVFQPGVAASPYPDTMGQEKCFYGHLCEVKCPAGCLNFENNNLVFSADNCTGCKSCITQCPGKALTFVGNMLELDEVMEEVLKDMDFYQESKGGVTLSGGEVLVQPDFAAALLKKCKRERNPYRAGDYSFLHSAGVFQGPRKYRLASAGHQAL